MKNLLYLPLFLLFALAGCSDDNADPDEETIPDPLTVTSINATIWNGTGFEGVNLLNGQFDNVDIDTEFIVTFSKPVLQAWLANESTPKLLVIENDEPVAGVNLDLTVLSSTEIILSPTEVLTNGTSYEIVINSGYEAEDGGLLEDHAIAEFITYEPDPLTVSSMVASDGSTDISLGDQSAATGVPVDASITITFSDVVILTDTNKEKFSIDLLINDVVDSQVTIQLSEDLINKTITVTPSENFTAGTTYQLVLTDGIEHDLGGTLESEYIAKFTTE